MGLESHLNPTLVLWYPDIIIVQPKKRDAYSRCLRISVSPAGHETKWCGDVHAARQTKEMDDCENLLAKLEEQEKVLAANRDLLVKHLDTEDIVDQLIQEGLMGRDAAQRIQLMGTSEVDKNRIIIKQLTTAGPGALEKFCAILRVNKRQSYLAEQLERDLLSEKGAIKSTESMLNL